MTCAKRIRADWYYWVGAAFVLSYLAVLNWPH
jgi:hypothetical protein